MHNWCKFFWDCEIFGWMIVQNFKIQAKSFYKYETNTLKILFKYNLENIYLHEKSKINFYGLMTKPISYKKNYIDRSNCNRNKLWSIMDENKQIW